MALRLIELVVPQDSSGKIEQLLKGRQILDQKRLPLSDKEVLVRILLRADATEEILDLLEKQFLNQIDTRVLIIPVEGIWPLEEEQKPPSNKKKPPERIDREELYANILDAARCSKTYLMMILLSTIVAALGLYTNNVTVIIGAMVIAPMLGPNMALSLGTTLGDLSLIRHALWTGVVGIALAAALSILLGLILHVSPSSHESLLRTHVGINDFAIALAAGSAGSLAFTTGLSATLIGVMVSLAVLPSLVTFGLFLGSGEPALAFGALLLFAMNIIFVNLAGIVTFLIKGIHPASWWEKDRAIKATRIAIALWVLVLGAWIALFFLLSYTNPNK